MTVPDLINATFEALAAAFIFNHARVLWASMQAYGISLLSTVFFTAWSFWNIWYFYKLDQVFSFWVSIIVTAAQLFWVYSIWKIRTSHQGESDGNSSVLGRPA